MDLQGHYIFATKIPAYFVQGHLRKERGLAHTPHLSSPRNPPRGGFFHGDANALTHQ
ncbi:hypothetical protein THICB2_100008 [Thiomonas sp. CB2]|nr:hypothetical protein THICB2_100008 [Thiomonas sp. CB2]CQR44002.1 hypothetical protein THICB3470071 [Thiomonas sp. CB3]VDY10709.1 protein of unknown function [Thiomonas sp. Sup16B3]VDY14255.1 conserved protein of unknown function [Thiomonas sp. OC7]VDY16549.1 protein of unknown function [Thiomonas sp. CB2]